MAVLRGDRDLADVHSTKVTDEARELVNPFQTGDDTTDIQFTVDAKKLHFNKGVLCVCSPVFTRMFTGEFREKNAREIALPGKKYSDIVTFFRHMHPVFLADTPVTDDTLLPLLELADEYDVKHVCQKCERYINAQLKLAEEGRQHLSMDRTLLFLQACDRHDLRPQREWLVQVIAKKKTRELTWSQNFSSFPADFLADVFRLRCEHLEVYSGDLTSVVRKIRTDVSGHDWGRTLNLPQKCKDRRACGNALDTASVCEECRVRKMTKALQVITDKLRLMDLHAFQ